MIDGSIKRKPLVEDGISDFAYENRNKLHFKAVPYVYVYSPLQKLERLSTTVGAKVSRIVYKVRSMKYDWPVVSKGNNVANQSSRWIPTRKILDSLVPQVALILLEELE